jgi:hypothetical protein
VIDRPVPHRLAERVASERHAAAWIAAQHDPAVAARAHHRAAVRAVPLRRQLDVLLRAVVVARDEPQRSAAVERALERVPRRHHGLEAAARVRAERDRGAHALFRAQLDDRAGRDRARAVEPARHRERDVVEQRRIACEPLERPLDRGARQAEPDPVERQLPHVALDEEVGRARHLARRHAVDHLEVVRAQVPVRVLEVIVRVLVREDLRARCGGG